MLNFEKILSSPGDRALIVNRKGILKKISQSAINYAINKGDKLKTIKKREWLARLIIHGIIKKGEYTYLSLFEYVK